MEIRRTANAGVLLTLDDAKILLDGVCREVNPYPATPANIGRELTAASVDALLFTHSHPDHFDPVLSAQLNAPIYGPEQAGEQISCPVSQDGEAAVGTVRIYAVSTRHMGHYGKTTQHQSYVVKGSKNLWFMGDASPMELKKLASFGKPDVLLIPYPYITTPAAMKLWEELLPCRIVLLHMPPKNNDPEGIWQSAEAGMMQLKAYLSVPEMGEILNF